MGPFGSNTHRFQRSWLDAKDGPDPGQYIGELVKVNKMAKVSPEHSLLLRRKGPKPTASSCLPLIVSLTLRRITLT